MIGLRDLQSRGLLPEGLYELDLSRAVGVSKFEELSEEDKNSSKIPVVIDDAIWVASTSPLDQNGEVSKDADVFSSDGKLVGKQIRGTKFSVFEVGDTGLMVIDHKNLKLPQNKNNKKEGQSMANIGDFSNLSVESLSQELAADASTQKMESFTTGAAEGGETNRPALNTRIAEALASIEIANPSYLQEFNFKHGRLIGYITAQDEKVEFVAKQKNRRNDDGHLMLDPGAPEAVVAEFEATGKAPSKWLQKVYDLEVRQQKPGKILGLVASIPLGGFVKVLDFRKPGILEADESKTDLVYELLNTDQYEAFIDMYFGSKIKEDPTTHGGASRIVHQISKAVAVTSGGALTGQQKIVKSLKVEGRRSILQATNYFPINTFETIDVSGPLTAEQIDVLNTSAFINFMRVSSREGAPTTSKYDLLSAESRKMITRDGDKIGSVFFTNDANARQALHVIPFYGDKESAPLEKVEIPVKVRSETKTGKILYRFVKYSCVDEKVLNDPAARAKTSLYNGRFQTIIDAAHGAINVDTLRSLTRKARGKAKPANILSNEQVLKMQLGIEEGIFGEELQIDGGKASMESLMRSIESIRMNAN